jgi:hypothetical protein
MGTPYGQYLLDDVAAGRVHADLYVFLTAWSLSPIERRQLLAATQGSLRIWCYAPGYLEPERASLDAMGELTGFRMKRVTDIQARAEPTALGRRLGLRSALGIAQPLAPLFAAADASADETLATYSDGSAAVALRDRGGDRSLFVGPPGLSSELLRLAARHGKVHLFTQSDCNVYANGPYLVLHASQDGPLEIDTGKVGPIRDLLSGQPIGDGAKLLIPLKKGETRILAAGSTK